MPARKPAAKATPVARRDVDADPVEETVAEETVVTEVEDAEELLDETTIVDDDADEADTDDTEDEAERAVSLDDELAEVRALYATHNIKLGANPYQAIRTLCDKVIELRSLAADGRRYRKDLEQEAESALVRAMGGSVKLETYRSVFKRSSIDELKTLIADYTAQGDQRFPGGRHTTDEEGDSKLITLSPQKPSKAHHA